MSWPATGLYVRAVARALSQARQANVYGILIRLRGDVSGENEAPGAVRGLASPGLRSPGKARVSPSIG